MKQVDTIREFMRRDKVFSSVYNPTLSHVDISQGDILYVEDLTVTFDGFKAIDNLNLYVKAGELRCLIGPNGAGKTTLLDILTGKTRPDAGSVWFGRNIDLLRLTESEIACLGVGRKFQKPSVFENHSVLVNLELAMAGGRSVWDTLNGRITSEDQDRINSVLMQIGLSLNRASLAGSLSHGQKQWLEIGMLLMQSPALLLVDEPVAGMTHVEMERTAELLRSLAGQHTVVVVEHDMEFIRSIADTVTVLHQGSVLAEGSMDMIQVNPEVIEVYLGE